MQLTFKIFLFCSALATLTACKGKHTFHTANADLNSAIRIGDTVQSLGKAVLVIYQDQKNNYWFSSGGQGVCRYDGKTILQFTVKHGLVSNDIWGIQEDKYGNIYFDSQEGVGKFDGHTFSTLTVSNAPDHEWKLEPDDLWFKGNWNKNGPYRFDGKYLYHLEFPQNGLADELHASFPNMAWSPYGIYTLYKDKKGNIWFGTSNVGVYRFDGKSVSRMYEDHLTNTPNGGSFGIRSIFEDKDGKFWFCNTRYRYNIHPGDSTVDGQRLIHYDREKGIEQVNDKDRNGLIYFMSITEDHQQNLWMVTYEDGVWRYDGKNMTPYLVKDGTKNITLFSIYKDNRGDLWLGTHEAGAYRFNGETFEKFRP